MSADGAGNPHGDDKPRVGISACLLGEEVRYDGDHKRSPVVVEILGELFEWVPMCPEMDIGMGVPREPIRLLEDEGRARLVGVESGRDWTMQMGRYADRRADELSGGRVHGFVLKARSPSCAIDDVAMHDSEGEVYGTGAGAFTRVLRTRLPALPIIDEGRLAEAAERDTFVARVYGYHQRLLRR